MGVRTVIGIADGTNHAAVMYDSASGWTIGPVWESADAEDQIEAFLDWMDKEQFIGLAEEIGLESRDLPSPMLPSKHVQFWPDTGLQKLISYWRSTHLDENGLLRQPVAA